MRPFEHQEGLRNYLGNNNFIEGWMKAERKSITMIVLLWQMLIQVDVYLRFSGVAGGRDWRAGDYSASLRNAWAPSGTLGADCGFLYGIHILQIAPYKFIHPWATSLTTRLSKIRLRQVVDIGEANPTLSKILKLSHFLMPKHVPNVVAITCYRLPPTVPPPITSASYIQIHSSTNHQHYNTFIQKSGSDRFQI